jgi:uncharacterized protein (UPF0332 family)
MSLPDDLLEQAGHLASRERTRPKQASLRRAISVSYYAVFHLLVDDATKLILPGQGEKGSRGRVGRTFDHGAIKKVCLAFWGKLKASEDVVRLVQAYPQVPAELIVVISAFVDLQDARHEADYNTARKYKRQEATSFVDVAREAFSAWRMIKNHPVARTYLIALVAWKKWDHL